MNYPGQVLKRGAKGEAVRAVQQRLGVQQTTLFGPTTEEIVTRFQRSRGLEADGEVGPQTWAALFEAAPSATRDLGQKALHLARSHSGTREQPLGSNRGPQVDQWNANAGAPPGSFWCMSFVYSMAKDAAAALGIPNPLPRTASCSALFRWARANGRLTVRPEPGDIFLCRGGETGHYHTGLVVALLPNGRVSTIEGNSNSTGSANGIEVAYRPRGRAVSTLDFVRL